MAIGTPHQGPSHRHSTRLSFCGDHGRGPHIPHPPPRIPPEPKAHLPHTRIVNEAKNKNRVTGSTHCLGPPLLRWFMQHLPSLQSSYAHAGFAMDCVEKDEESNRDFCVYQQRLVDHFGGSPCPAHKTTLPAPWITAHGGQNSPSPHPATSTAKQSSVPSPTKESPAVYCIMFWNPQKRPRWWSPHPRLPV